MVSLAMAVGIGYGLEGTEGFETHGMELAILAVAAFVLMGIMGRDTGREDETAGIISMDDDD